MSNLTDLDLATKIDKGFVRLTTLLKLVRDSAKSARGDLTALNTNDKTSLVNALNEIKSLVSNTSGIDDSVTSSDATWSSTKINNAITNAISDLIGGADVDSDSLKELADKITALVQADNGLVSAAEAQAFTAPQKQQARDNIDVFSKDEIGDIGNIDFVATINSTYTESTGV